MKKNNLENFEKEYMDEIQDIQSLVFKRVTTPEFKFPGYNFFMAKSLSIAFAVPALVAVFGLFFYNTNTDSNSVNLSMLEDSNERILNQIDKLDYENEI